MIRIESRNEAEGSMRREADPGTFRMVAIVGGGRQASEMFFRRGGADLTVVLDNPEEVATLQRCWGNQGDVVFFPLAGGETADTLALNAPERVRGLLLSRASMSSDSGLGQIPGVGQLAAVHQRKQDAYRNFLRNLKSIVTQATAGQCNGIELICTGSGAGGTFSGVGLDVVCDLLQPLSDIGVGVHVVFSVLDATTFAGLGHRCGMNNAATVARLASWVAEKGGRPHDRVTRAFHLTALPPLGKEVETRSRLVALDEQAWNSRGLQRQLGIEAPNRALDGPLGSILYRQTAFMGQLNAEAEVANAVAIRYLPHVKDAIEGATVVRELVEDVSSDTTTTPLHRGALVALIDEQPQLDDDEFLDAVCRPKERLSCTGYATLATGERYELSAIEEELYAPAKSLDEAVHRLRLVMTIADRIDAELAMVKDEIDSLEMRILEVKSNLRRILRKLNRGCWFCRRSRLQQHLFEWSCDLREHADQLSHRRAVEACLTEGLETVTVVQHRLATDLEDLQTSLESFRPRGHAQPDQRLFVTPPLNEVWPDLQGFASESHEMQTWLLGNMVERVTLQGLLVLTNARRPTVAGVVEQLINGKRDIVGPYPGACAPPNGGQQYFVVPPVLPALADELRAELNRRLPDAHLFEANSCCAGVSIVVYRVFRPANRSELFPGTMARDLEDARNSEIRDLLFPEDPDSLFVLTDRCPTGPAM